MGRRLECELHPQWFTFFRVVCALEREVENCVLSHSHSSHGFGDFLTSVFCCFGDRGSLYTSDCPGASCVNQAGHKLPGLLACFLCCDTLLKKSLRQGLIV